ncbi:MAG: ATP-binding protein [Myxococcaceae bacterium]|nr:ATP-binding protein [Myxococcaceae bacterium]
MRWQTFIEGLLHPSLRGHGPAWRARFLVECLLVGQTTAAFFSVVHVARGRFGSAAASALGAVLLFGLARILRVTGRIRLVTHGALGASLLSFLSLAAIEPALDPAMLAWLAVVPFLAALLLDGRVIFLWLVLTLGALGLVFVLRAGGAAPTGEGPVVLLSVMRLGALFIVVFYTGLRFALEQRRTVAELEAASRAKSAFLATMSHEIRTPMNGVLGLTEVLLSGPLDVETREKLGLVRESGHTLVALINDILDYSKFEAGKLTITPTDFDLRALVDEVTALHRAPAQLKGVGLVLSLEGALPKTVRGDGLRLRQVLSNLVSNAVKFTERGEVRVVVGLASAEPLRVRVSVADTGIGISAGAVERLFSPFEQAERSTTRRFGGTGLGLALSRNLVRLMGGDITVESVEGVGSRFWFDVPLEVGMAALAPSEPEVTPAAERSVLPVLVVDDNPINLKVACSLVEKAGYRTQVAENGAEALELVQTQPFLLVLMDCHMPVMDGFAATERIRGLDGDVSMTPIVALTASAMPEELEACKRSGMNECLTKPVSLAALKAVLQRVEHYRRIMEGAA